MLDLEDLTVLAPPRRGEDAAELLHAIRFRIPASHFCAVIGPSGCGKSTLLKAVAGLVESSEGNIYWKERNLEEDGDLEPWEVGYVPQFSIAYEHLTVYENLNYALRLRVAGLDHEARESRIDAVLNLVGLMELEDRQVRVISGGQRRRLALALELLSRPSLMLCDEVTSGLDPKSEKDILRLMHGMSREEGRIVMSVTHSLAHFELYDSVIVLYEGKLVYHGPPAHLLHYFGIEDLEQLFPILSRRTGAEWDASWVKKRKAYYEKMIPPFDAESESSLSSYAPPKRREARDSDDSEKPEASEKTDRTDRTDEEEEESASARIPGPVSQAWTLFSRRVRILMRDKSQLILQCALILVFPAVVAIFAMDGLPQIQNLSTSGGQNLMEEAQEVVAFSAQAPRVGMLVSGLIMFQVVLLALMGSNNGAREIAGERPIFEKEKLAGLHAGAYVASKVVFVGILVVAQSAWMAFFVDWIVRFEGSFEGRLWQLVLINAAITAICLGISSFSRSPEQASLLSLYLVGFQLPLSGAMLALPEPLDAFIRPFISAYWGWSGSLQTMSDTSFYDMVLQITQTPLAGFWLAVCVLAAHVVLGIMLAWVGSRNSRWNSSF